MSSDNEEEIEIKVRPEILHLGLRAYEKCTVDGRTVEELVAEIMSVAIGEMRETTPLMIEAGLKQMSNYYSEMGGEEIDVENAYVKMIEASWAG